jgi:hypothetical protein
MDNICVEDESGIKEWYLNGQLHREDGPAVERVNGDKFWFLNGQLHREDGPAIEWADGTKFWYLNGQRYSFSEWCELIVKSYEEKCELVLIYG